MRVRDVLALGQVLQVQQPGVQPVVVRVLGGQRRLHLVVLDDAALRGVDEEHPAWLQAALAHDRGRVELEHADLAGQDDQPVVGHPEPARPQAVAVQHRADHGAVGERHARGPVPRLHQRRVELVERAPGRVHRRVVLPRLRDHHQHRVRQRPAGQVQQLEHLVEAGRVAGVLGADREQPRQVAGQHVAGQLRLARVHPVAVASQGVDLAVVRDVAVRVRERPGRERVRREPRVHQDQRAGEPAVGQVGEERLELGRGEHPLVDERAGRQRGEVRRRSRGRRACARRTPAARAPGRRAGPTPARGTAAGSPASPTGRWDRPGPGGWGRRASRGRSCPPASRSARRPPARRRGRRPAGRRCRRRTHPWVAAGSRRRRAGTRPGPAAGCRPRRRCRGRRRRRRGARGCAARSDPGRRSRATATPDRVATMATPQASCS